MEDTPHFAYTVSSCQHATFQLTATITCAEIVRRKIRLSTDETIILTIPDQTIVYDIGFIPLYDAVSITPCPYGTTVISRPTICSLNCAGISQIMSRFGNYSCSTNLHEIDAAVMSSLLVGREVIEVKIWKIRTKVYDIDGAPERLLIQSESSVSAKDSSAITLRGMECVICMEDYTEGSVVGKLPCDHDFHGVCIYKWSLMKHHCPLCRVPISQLFYFLFV